jgi:hypothetical protein
MVGLDVVELEHAREGVEYLRRGVVVATAFEPEVVVRADAGEERDLLSPESRHPAVRAGGQADVLGSDRRASRAEILPEATRILACVHGSTVRASLRAREALSLLVSAGTSPPSARSVTIPR